jgi:hypothetical protein
MFSYTILAVVGCEAVEKLPLTVLLCEVAVNRKLNI